ncbi:VOC family protein [Zobellella maritima]|uniref:VOC family protein n=1 Tax=Zobellella maritima TaxID=2059725 RepID=UPI001E49A01F|nr:VOC family protein [Zobellella maritima]
MSTETPALSALLGDIDNFLLALEEGLARHRLQPGLGQMDHICYRADSNRQYLRLRAALLAYGENLVEGMIGGRPIITYALHSPIASQFGPIPCLELAAPKPGKQHLTGLEHGELVVEDLHRLLAANPHVPFNTKGLAQSPAELSLALPPYQVKFHQRSLAEIIAEEKDRGLVVPVPEDYWLADKQR